MSPVLRALVLLACFAMPVMATPPDIITIRDDPFGLTPNAIYLLRTTSDNLGQHGTERNDTLLVIRSLATGGETILPVSAAMRQWDHISDDAVLPLIVEITHAPDAPDPFARLSQEGGLPWAAARFGGAWQAPELSFDADVLTVTYPHSGTFARPTPDVMTQFALMMRNTAIALPNYTRLAPIATADLLRTDPPDPAICAATDPVRAAVDYTQTNRAWVRVACDIDGMEAPHSFLIQLHPVP